ncbi:hypothetical protein NQ176_g11314 [Zarea fungicola]|uniref:Uncharacterized protein n=1 Tax=Zarea fungicola TaxID=93591 RepID=A0ACC1MC04_9HYPO|nr:hypothetical protein NQ176_g11314 [Lecanicillium fungicola]
MEAIDTTFSDAGKGPWTIQKGESQVKQIICDPAFKATAATTTTTTTTTTTSATASATAAPPPVNNQGSGSASSDKPDTSIRVVLSDEQETGSQTEFTEAGLKREQHSPAGTLGPFKEVTLELGKDVKDKELRCAVINKKNKKPITLKRGTSVEVTFSDEGKGAWTFLEPYSAEVLDIICDPAFVKKTQTKPQSKTQ